MVLVIPLVEGLNGTLVIPLNATPINVTLPPTSVPYPTIHHNMTTNISSTAPVALPQPQTPYIPHFPAMEPQAIGLVILAAIAILLDIPCIIWHGKSRNTAACCLVGWIIILNLFNFINPIIWPNDDFPNQWQGQGLCDIEAKLQVGSYLGLTGALAAIMRDLCHVMNTKRIELVPSHKRQVMNRIITGTLCFGFPILIMGLHYIVQSVRYYVFDIDGCAAAIDSSWLAVVLVEMWPLILAVVDAGLAILLCWRMHVYRSDFGRLIAISKTTKSRFLRLFLISLSMVLIFLPLQIYIFIRNIEFGVGPFHWSWTHNPGWNYIQILPSFGIVAFDRWIQCAAGYLMFLFFGLGEDALKMYRLWLRKIGLGKVFPSLNKDGPVGGLSFGLGTWNSLNSRARSLLNKRRKATTTNDSGLGTTNLSGNGTAATVSLPRASISTAAPTNGASSPRLKNNFGDSPRDDTFGDLLLPAHASTTDEKQAGFEEGKEHV